MGSRLENLLGALAVALSDAMGAEVEEAAGHGGGAGAALAVLAQEPGLGIEQLKVPLRRTQSATVRIVDRLVADGYAERRPGADNRRIAVVLTEQGTAAAAGVLDSRRAVLRAAVGSLGPDEQRVLEDLLVKLLTAVTVDADQAEQICRLCDVAACPLRICPVERAGGGEREQPGRPRPRPVQRTRPRRSPRGAGEAGPAAAGRRGPPAGSAGR